MDDEEAKWRFTENDTDDEPQELTDGALSWTASEYIAHEKQMMWYVSLFAISIVITALVYLINRDTLTSIVILTISICAAFFASRKPASRRYDLTARGLAIDDILHKFSDFKSFSVVEEGAINSIWLKPLNRYKPLLIIYFAPDDEAVIIDHLSAFLPHEQRELDAIDKLSRYIRF